jgi:hypothetical protein
MPTQTITDIDRKISRLLKEMLEYASRREPFPVELECEYHNAVSDRFRRMSLTRSDRLRRFLRRQRYRRQH